VEILLHSSDASFAYQVREIACPDLPPSTDFRMNVIAAPGPS
jgi:hypothetical protein